jgi:hypothetical protein
MDSTGDIESGILRCLEMKSLGFAYCLYVGIRPRERVHWLEVRWPGVREEMEENVSCKLRGRSRSTKSMSAQHERLTLKSCRLTLKSSSCEFTDHCRSTGTGD